MGQNNPFRNNYCLLGVLDMPVVWFFCGMSLFCLFIYNFLDFLQVARNIQKSRPIPYTSWKRTFRCFEIFYHLNLYMILNESSCNICFLIANQSHIYSGKFLILICYPKIFSTNQNSGFSKLTQKYTWYNRAVRLIFFLVTRRS